MDKKIDKSKLVDFLAAEEGFEPSQTESESVVLTVTLFGNMDFQRGLSYHILSCLSREKTKKEKTFHVGRKKVEKGEKLCYDDKNSKDAKG